MSELSKMVLDYYKNQEMDIDSMLLELDNLKIDLVQDYLDNQEDGSVYVIKRSGNIEPFSSDKILRSIKNAADENSQQLNASDVEILTEDIQKYLSELDRKVYKTGEIKEFVKKALTEEGYSQIRDSYETYIEKQTQP